MSFVPFTDVITNRTVLRSADDSRYLLGSKPEVLALFVHSEPVPAFIRHNDAERIAPSKSYPHQEAFYAVQPTKYGRVRGLTPALVQTFWAELERRGALTWAEAKRLLGSSLEVRNFAADFGKGDETTFYISRAASEAWTRLTQYLAG